MASRTINLSEDAYARLSSLKKDGESFSDVVNRLTGKFALLDLVGLLDEKAASRLREAAKELDSSLREDMTRTAKKVS